MSCWQERDQNPRCVQRLRVKLVQSRPQREVAGGFANILACFDQPKVFVPLIERKFNAAKEEDKTPAAKSCNTSYEIVPTYPHAGMQVHGVPLEERAFDSKGHRLPWAYEYLE